MTTILEHFSIRGFTLLDGRRVRLFCRLRKQRETEVATYRLYEDHRGRQWLEIITGSLSDLEEWPGGSFEQRVATDLLVLGLNKYSG